MAGVNSDVSRSYALRKGRDTYWIAWCEKFTQFGSAKHGVANSIIAAISR